MNTTSKSDNAVTQSVHPQTKRRVSYFYTTDIGLYYYGPGHPMKPHRMRMAHNLILGYGLYRKMDVYKPRPCNELQMQKFHSIEYTEFLKRITPETMKKYQSQLQKFNIGEFTDCPIFDGLYDFCASSSGCSIDGAVKLNHGLTDIAINWSGGLHHAKKSEASGFCYINDIVLGILELLKYHPRVVYIDIDVHHGDGVEEAFYTTDRVMTVSFHKYGDFFPGTGDVKDIGSKNGKYYSVNVPLHDGMDDASYETIFKPVMNKVMEMYRPTAIVLQCGADSLTGDRLGPFNLTLRGHAMCVEHMRSFHIPMLVLGGGGYTVRNVARCWAYETAVCCNQSLPDEIPYNDFYEYYAPDFKLHLTPTNAENMNKRDYLDAVTARVLQNLQNLQGAPSVQMQAVPPDWVVKSLQEPQEVEDKEPDKKTPPLSKHGAIKAEKSEEFYDGDKDQDQNGSGESKNSASKEKGSQDKSSSSSDGNGPDTRGEVMMNSGDDDDTKKGKNKDAPNSNLENGEDEDAPARKRQLIASEETNDDNIAMNVE